jgi:2-hydroxy-3-keto-5-methylthiopentenyl-1-phosphate phosphatase
MDRFRKIKGREVISSWKKREIVFLIFEHVFSTINRSVEEIDNLVLEIPFDNNAKGFIDSIKKSRRRIYMIILSAGTGSYIEKIFKHYGIDGVQVISNKVNIGKGAIHMTADTNSPYYSESYGIDKIISC